MLYDRRIAARTKEKVYKMVVTCYHVLFGDGSNNKKISEDGQDQRDSTGDKVRGTRLRFFGHVQRKDSVEDGSGKEGDHRKDL